jgi:hypothetical protein
MSVALKFARGSQFAVGLAFPAGIDLTGATLEAVLKYSLSDADDAALARSFGDSPTLTALVVEAISGLGTLTFLSEATSGIPAGLIPWWQVTVILPGGTRYIFQQHQGPVYLTPTNAGCLCDDFPPQPGVTTVLDDTSSASLLPLMLSNVVINRYDISRLLGGSLSALDGISAATLVQLQNGTILRLFFAGSIMADFRLRANAGSETESAPWRVLCDNASGRLFELVGVWKQGTPCVWDTDLNKHRQVLVAGGSLAIADAGDAFVIPQ